MQNEIDYVALTPIILSVLAAGGSAYAWIKSSGRRNADEASILTGVALQMVNELQEQYKNLRVEFDSYKLTTDERIAEQAAIIAQQAERISVLEKENYELKIENSRYKSGRRGNL